jgi:putative CocE/NonD family hydrolase
VNRQTRAASLVLSLLLTPALARLAAAAAADDGLPAEVDLRWGVKIPLRDGVHLNATVYQPKGQKEPLPVVFTLTPYIGDTYHERAMYFARNGYVFALVDVRGRGSSEGAFEPFANEGRDGYDVVEWLAKQPWSNGRIAMWGGSYAGYDQWATAKELPPHLATFVPAASVHPGLDFPINGNIFHAYSMQWITYTSGATPNRNLFGEGLYWMTKDRDLYVSQRPFAELDQLVGNPSPIFHKWLANPIPGPYWDAMVPTPEQYAKLTIPILTITGHYDGDQPGALTYYRRHMQYGSAEAKAKHYLVIGPWDHAGTRTPNRQVGGLNFGPASLVDLNQLHKEWYDWTMKAGPRPKFLEQRVAYYVPPIDAWKYAGSLDEIAPTALTLYLASDGEAQDAFHSGQLAKALAAGPGAAPADTYTYDPKDTHRADDLGRELDANLLDQSAVLSLAGDGLVYHSEPFADSVEITGWPKLTAWIALDVPDVDFEADLYEILPQGGSVYLSGTRLRARYRESLRAEKLVEPGKVLPYTFDAFTYFSRRVAKGSRLRLVVTSPNEIGAEKNFCSGGVVAEESGKDARTAHVRLVHDAAHPSKLELPIGR